MVYIYIYGNIYHQYTPNVGIYHTLWVINKKTSSFPIGFFKTESPEPRAAPCRRDQVSAEHGGCLAWQHEGRGFSGSGRSLLRGLLGEGMIMLPSGKLT